MKPTCVAIDFDDTISHLNRNHDALFEIFGDYGAKKQQTISLYEGIKRNGGFSFPRFLSAIQEKTGRVIPPEAETRCREWLRASLVAYPESISAIATWRTKNIPVVIVTMGEEQYQKEKIALLKVPYDELCAIAPPQKKLDVLKMLLARYGQPIAFIDDNAEELDSVRDEGIAENSVATFHLVRPNPRHPNKPTHPHITINSLSGLF